MNSICSSSHCRADAGFQATNFARAGIRTQSTADLSFKTSDGDIVTLSSHSLQQAQYSTYDFRGRLQGQAVAAHGETLGIESRTALAVSVQGELDEDEWADIQKVLDAVKAAGSDLASGNLDRARSPFENLGELDSLQSFQANLSFSREASALQASSRTARGHLPVSTIREEEPSVSHEQSLFQRLLDAVEQLDQHGKDHLAKQLTERLEKLSENGSLNDRERQLAEKISSELLQRHTSV